MASSRVYIGKLPQDVRRADIEELFKGYGVRITALSCSSVATFC